MVTLGDVSYDVRFAREKAKSDLAALEADANAVAERIKGRFAGIGFGGGGGGGGVPHNGANGSNGQPVAAVAAPSNGAASRFVQQATEQNAAIAAAAKNPMLRAAYQNNPAFYGAQFAQQLGATTAQVAAAFSGNGNGNGNGQPKANGVPGVNGGASVLNGNGGNVIQVHVTNWPGGLGGGGGMGTGGGGGGTAGTSPNAFTGLPVLGKIGAYARGIGVAAAAAYGASYLVNSAGDAARSYNDLLQDQLAAGSNPFRREQANYANFRRVGFAGEGALINRIPVVGSVYQSGQDIGEAAANLSNQHLGTSFGTPAFLSQLDQKMQFDLMMTQNFAGSTKNHQLSTQGRMTFSPFGARMNSLGAEREFSNTSLEVQRQTMLLAATTDDQRRSANTLIDSQKKAVENTYKNSVAGINTELNISNIMLTASIMQKTGQSNLRPVAGFASATSLAASALFEERIKESDLINDPVVRARSRENARLSAKDSLADLNVSRTDVLKNIFGGRPTEITGLQSVEAMRDISPETNEDAFRALTDAIKDLTDLLARNP